MPEFWAVKDKYVVSQVNGTKSIAVQCPRCGKWGVLKCRKKTLLGNRWHIFHKNAERRDTWCSIGSTEEASDILLEIYRRVWGDARPQSQQ